MTQNDPRNPGVGEDEEQTPEREPMKAPGREDEDDQPQRDPDIGNDEIDVEDLDDEPRKP